MFNLVLNMSYLLHSEGNQAYTTSILELKPFSLSAAILEGKALLIVTYLKLAWEPSKLILPSYGSWKD